ncbi:hypothetical protein LX32DRAFT_31150 [Colletotrichum zoysiae]|uniref:Uncharacterized protein n=1 Tax=Colletotrichum zoysiae TaxID=1216348 RepID=A0AAD9HCC7_9PEZI|nr:hypothetical protein LX32DRAFT_31150 [Colletotrichum zoysiae]
MSALPTGPDCRHLRLYAALPPSAHSALRHYRRPSPTWGFEGCARPRKISRVSFSIARSSVGPSNFPRFDARPRFYEAHNSRLTRSADARLPTCLRDPTSPPPLHHPSPFRVKRQASFPFLLCRSFLTRLGTTCPLLPASGARPHKRSGVFLDTILFILLSHPPILSLVCVCVWETRLGGVSAFPRSLQTLT